MPSTKKRITTYLTDEEYRAMSRSAAQAGLSLSKYVKDHVKSSVSFITDFESILSEHAKRHRYDGVICGHIHKAEIRTIDGIEYLNCGDWVESCTAIVETYEGEFRIIRWLGH